ncbi:hypothetical protein ACZ90_40930 [Streptomyces albus subsp. albus]|nr:hypothetical protein ACZ90_40930 [Streptomyces albus subsp. albus]
MPTSPIAAALRAVAALLRLAVPDAWAVPAVLVISLAVVAYVLRCGDPVRPWSGALLVTGTVFLLTTPGYSWYALLLIALVALDGRWEWLGVAVAGTAAYVTNRAVPGSDAVGTTAYAVAGLAVIAGWALRRRSAAGARSPQPTQRRAELRGGVRRP